MTLGLCNHYPKGPNTQVADAAAKAARERTMPFIYDVLHNVEAHSTTRRDMLHSFFLYQAELTKLVAGFNPILDTGTPPTGLQGQDHRQQWLDLQPRSSTVYIWPQLQEDWLEIAPWPPWFLTSVWRWTTQLSWLEARGRSGRHGGITYLELLANYVAVSRTIPPFKGSGSRYTDIDPLGADGILMPVVSKECIMTPVAAVRYLERQANITLWHAGHTTKLEVSSGSVRLSRNVDSTLALICLLWITLSNFCILCSTAVRLVNACVNSLSRVPAWIGAPP